MNADEIKQFTSSCAEGRKVISGGCRILFPDLFSLVDSAPANTADGWQCRAKNISGAQAGGSILRIRLICGDVVEE
ncbi:MAG: hypothetical protein KDD62_03325 [Bdellovibrionales bacterium]|nr:hypothetical protein [Bdellovibrionales bacterium]